MYALIQISQWKCDDNWNRHGRAFNTCCSRCVEKCQKTFYSSSSLFQSVLLSFFWLSLLFSLSMPHFYVYIPQQKRRMEWNSSQIFLYSLFLFRPLGCAQLMVCGRWNGANYILNRQIFRRWSGWNRGNTTTERRKCKETDKLFFCHCSLKIV